jgi:hypothetical protein
MDFVNGTSLLAGSATEGTSTGPSPLIPAPTEGIDMGSLIGRPHLFGRVRNIRNGVHIEPIGTLTMQPDGRITGHGHHNEGSWIPYIHSPVSGDKAFAFISAHNKWIPSSTWTHSRGSIPIGYFCDEPESGNSAQELCLIPQVAVPAETVICYLVASCLRFYERTIPPMLEQLFAEGIPPSRIKVVVNGCAEDDDRVIEGVAYAFSSHDAWEWTALYEAPLRWSFDYCFLIHDTSLVLPGFRRSVEAINGHIAWDHLPASPMARCLLGLYSHNFLMRSNAWLRSLDHIDKKNGVIAEVAGELLLRARSVLAISDPESNGAARATEWKEHLDYFNTGSMRVRRVFPAVKVHKFLHSANNSPTNL